MSDQMNVVSWADLYALISVMPGSEQHLEFLREQRREIESDRLRIGHLEHRIRVMEGRLGSTVHRHQQID